MTGFWDIASRQKVFNPTNGLITAAKHGEIDQVRKLESQVPDLDALELHGITSIDAGCV